MNNDTYFEIDTKVIEENIKNIISSRSEYKYYIGILKGKAYGYGYEIAKTIIKTGINYLAVATIDEALKLREYIGNDFPIMCLQPVDFKYIKTCLDNNITITIPDISYYKKLVKEDFSSSLKVQLKLNTGMNRIGLETQDEVKFIYDDLIKNKKYNILLEGIYSHFASLGIVDDLWDKQVNKFKELTSLISLSDIKMVHMFSSNSLSAHPKLDFCNATRIGQLMFGNYLNNINEDGFINKLKKMKRNYIRKKLNLSPLNEKFYIPVNPAIKLISTIQSIKWVKMGEKVGYDGEYVMNEDGYVAMIPIGYADGMNKNFKGKDVIIGGKRYKIIGNINMCMTLIKVDKSIKLGDKVLLIGNDLTPKKVASSLEISVPYLLCSFENYIKRIYK